MLATLPGSAAGLAILSSLGHTFARKMDRQVEAIQLRRRHLACVARASKFETTGGRSDLKELYWAHYIFDCDMFLYQAFFQKWRIYHWRGEGGNILGGLFCFLFFSLHTSPPSEKSRRKPINDQHGSASNNKRVPRGIVRPRKSFACNSVYIF